MIPPTIIARQTSDDGGINKVAQPEFKPRRLINCPRGRRFMLALWLARPSPPRQLPQGDVG